MRRRRRLSNPVVKRRIALGVIGLGAALAGIAQLIRESTTGGSGSNSATYLLDVLGWLMVLAGAVIEASTAQIFFPAQPIPSSRRAIAFAVLGLVAAVFGCVLTSMVADGDTPAIVSAAGMSVLVIGVGLGLAGFFSLAWYYGGDYAARRIERLGDDDW